MEDTTKIGLGVLIFGLYVGFVIGGVLFDIVFTGDVELTQEVADDVCKQLSGNETAIAIRDLDKSSRGGRLICELPSFDATQNIIIKINNEE